MGKKRILVIARDKPAEALRVAVGLTLLNDTVRVVCAQPLPEDPAVQEQRDMLDFVEVPCLEVHEPAQLATQLAAAILDADTVYCL